MTRHDKVWKTKKLSKLYLEGIRNAIPLAEFQIETMLYLIQKTMPDVTSFLDLGCGDGILGRALLSKYPGAKGVFLDFSKTMIAAARKKMRKTRGAISFITQDYGKPSWTRSVLKHGKFDVIVSGFSIHHQPDQRKKKIYGEIFQLLNPGGLFLNLEHVSSPSARLKDIFDDYFIDAIHRYHHARDASKKREEIANAYHHRRDREANILAPLEKQCAWLRKIGFHHVDCYLKLFEMALFGGVKSDRVIPHSGKSTS